MHQAELERSVSLLTEGVSLLSCKRLGLLVLLEGVAELVGFEHTLIERVVESQEDVEFLGTVKDHGIGVLLGEVRNYTINLWALLLNPVSLARCSGLHCPVFLSGACYLKAELVLRKASLEGVPKLLGDWGSV